MSAHGAGKAYAIGLMMGLMSKGLTYDEAQWITVHPAGKGPKASGEGNKKGVPALIDGTTGKILGELGGKFTGKTIKQVKASSKKAKAEAAKTKPAEEKSNSSKGYRLDDALTVTTESATPEGWGERDVDGYPVDRKASIYYDQEQFDGRSKVGKAAAEDFKNYTTYSNDLNKRLRESKLSDQDKASVERMDAYIKEHPTKYEFSVYRGIENGDEARKMIESGEFQDDAYISTTPNLGTAQNYADANGTDDRYLFALRVPKGYGAASMNGLSVYQAKEREILLQRGSKGPITKLEKIKNKYGGFDYIAYVDLAANK